MEHDYNNIRTGTLRSHRGKTRITIYLDDEVLEHFRNVATENGRGYQTEINASLRDAMNRAQAQTRARNQERRGAPQVMIISVAAEEVLEHLMSKHNLPSAVETRASLKGEPIHRDFYRPFAREGKTPRSGLDDATWQRGRA